MLKKYKKEKSQRSNIFNLIGTLILNLFVFILVSCSPTSNNDNKVTFSGTVTLEDTTDYSGVTVSLYKPVELDTALVRINQEYPNIGVQISQETEFDHREHTPVYTTQTEADGSWEIKNVEKGEYNAAAVKNGCNWKYSYRNDEKIITFGTLPEAVNLDGTIDNDINIEQKLVIINNMQINNNVSVVFGNGTNILINKNGQIINNGELFFRGANTEPVKITCPPGEQWKIVQNNIAGRLELEHTIVSSGLLGIYNKSNNFSVKNSIFRDNDTALEIFNTSDSLNIENCIFKRNNYGIKNNSTKRVRLFQNIFDDNIEGTNVVSAASTMYKKCIFKGSNFGINVNPATGSEFDHCITNISNCEFEHNNIAIFLGHRTYHTSGHLSNFINNTYHIYIRGYQSSYIETLDFRNNYWGEFLESIIKEKIRDNEDENIPGRVIYYVKVDNFSLEPFTL